MKCPSCHAEAADDAAICPNCDHILDPSLFDAEPPSAEDDAEKTGARAMPVARPGPSARTSAQRPSGAKKAPPPKRPTAGARKEVARPAGPRMPEAPQKELKKERGDWRQKIEKEDWGPAPVPKAAPQKESIDPEDQIADVRRFIDELSSADKLALFGEVGVLMACFFPWKETVQDGAVLGLLSLGAVAFGTAIVAIGAIAMRVRKVLPTLNPVYPWVVQLLAVGIGLAWCLYYVQDSWDRTMARAPFGNEMVMVSKPSIGVILAVLAGGVAVLGTIVGLKETRT